MGGHVGFKCDADKSETLCNWIQNNEHYVKYIERTASKLIRHNLPRGYFMEN